MALAILYTPRSMTTEQYDAIIRHLDEAGQAAPAGRLYHIAFGSGSHVRVMDVFESKETFDAFAQGLVPGLQQLGIELENLDVSPILNVIAAEAQPARV